MREIETVTLVGLGAMGAFFTPGLTAALGSGFRVLAEGERKKRLERGVAINGQPVPVHVVEPGDDTGPADLVIIAVKDYALDQALAQMANQVGPDTILLPVLNGMTCVHRTGAVYGPEKVLHASMWVAASMDDGVAVYDSEHGLIRFGEAKNDTLSPRVQAVEALFRRAGIRYKIEPDMVRCQWLKFMGNVSENLPCALLGVPYGAYQMGGGADALRQAAMGEVAAVAKAAAGVELGAADMAVRDGVVARQDPASRPSTLQDLDRKKPTEVDLFAGYVVELGRQYGVPTPVCQVLLHGIHVLEAKNRGEVPGL